MLEISHLSKIYKNKKGKDVKALDDVSLKFPETGMVFLLGKSGSGKSTLLNVTGGLDNPSSGEIIIKGKSSKNFSQSDFDSYRNTYVGFIFQEYNILNEFSVYDNIALAIELQNKKVESEKILKLLKDVDLDGYEKRKPNTLSGGQKQRIAIARALIKNPEIIMADEPTGALDSNTGKQVLDTLKKLSKDRLVIVVSHDREFAETYADRIIELKDGKVISDNTKVNKKSEKISENINVFGDTLCINNGDNLTDSDFSKIKSFLKSSGKVLLSKDSKNISSFKNIARINDSDEQEIFEDTDEKTLVIKEYDQKKNIFIKSKLPMKHAIKIGVSGLKNKPFRLIFTILLCSVSFLLFGLLSTMTFYDSENVFKDTLEKINLDYVRFGKEYLVKEEYHYSDVDEPYSYESYYQTSFYKDDFENIKKKYGNDTFYGVDLYAGFSTQKSKNNYYQDHISTFAYIDETNSLRDKITGSYPKKDNEIVVSTFIVDSLIHYGVYDSKNVSLNLKNREDILNKSLNFGNKVYKVVGYFDSGELDSKYDILKENEDNNMVLRDFTNHLFDSLHLVAFVKESELNNISFESGEMYYSPSVTEFTQIVYKQKHEDKFSEYANASYVSVDHIDKDSVIGKELTDKSIYVSSSLYADLVINYYANKIYDNSKYEKIYNKAINLQAGGVYEKDNFIRFSSEEYSNRLKELYNLVKDSISVDTRLLSSSNGTTFGDTAKYTIAGICEEYKDQYVIVFNDNQFNKLWKIQKDKLDYYSEIDTKYKSKTTSYQTIFVPYNKDFDTINALWTIHSNKTPSNDDSRYVVLGSFIDTLSFLDELVGTLSMVFLYGGLFLCVFALLLLSNFISLSISNKTKEIGILRAVGARSIDVFKIFFSESFAITAICLSISLILCVSVCDILNTMLASEIGVSIFVFGVFSVVIMIGLTLMSTIIATYLPVRKAAKKKPVESIRSL